MPSRERIRDGANDRATDEPIASTAPCIPDDAFLPASSCRRNQVARKLRGSRRSSGRLTQTNNFLRLRQAWRFRIDLGDFVSRFEAQGPPGVASRCDLDIGQADRVGAGFYPSSAVATIAGGALAAEADEINLGIPLPPSLADRAYGI